MRELVNVMAWATVVTTGVSGAIGVFLWWRVTPRSWVWPMLRVGQVAGGLLAIAAGVRYVLGPEPSDSLFYLYTTLPIVIGFIAEQLRLASAETVLEQRDLEDAQAMRTLPEDEQHSIVLAIMRRELGVVATGSLVACFLALRIFAVA